LRGYHIVDDLRRTLKEDLTQFCHAGVNGRIIAKIFRGDIVHVESTVKKSLAKIPEKKTGIRLRLCVDFVGQLEKENFFGDVIFNFCECGITEVDVKRTYKESDLESYISSEGSR
jgi:hypothetical protein